MRYRYPLLAILALVLGLAIAGCGGGGGGSTSAQSESKESASSAGGYYSHGAKKEPASEDVAAEGASAVPVSTGEAKDVGTVLVDSKEMTLYYFEKDVKNAGKSTCSGPCATIWPPMITSGEAEAMSGADASMLGTIERSDGTMQVTYAGWPLYTYAGDKGPGEANGTDLKDFGGTWYPLHPNGQKAGH